ncbi:hypothetical protein [Bacteroides cellulosilyticus]|jgi:hypothetical protein|uniref:hypothetical protein n=1 Tax=Bacteroides cellulosilyticus TaxID=246787 RepID=UPI00189D9795|nr:hypothetical protein [Bacteroides cellulosilyticus]MBX9088495.1 hypothetical protein [Bacteroides cellulosilyticus]
MDMTTLLKIFSSIGENFICSTVQGLHWFFSQMLALFVLETILYIVGSLQGLLTLSFQIKRLLDEITLEKVLIVQYYIDDICSYIPFHFDRNIGYIYTNKRFMLTKKCDK